MIFEDKEDGEINILKTYMSNPIYVDSRKMAREIVKSKVFIVIN